MSGAFLAEEGTNLELLLHFTASCAGGARVTRGDGELGKQSVSGCILYLSTRQKSSVPPFRAVWIQAALPGESLSLPGCPSPLVEPAASLIPCRQPSGSRLCPPLPGCQPPSSSAGSRQGIAEGHRAGPGLSPARSQVEQPSLAPTQGSALAPSLADEGQTLIP